MEKKIINTSKKSLWKTPFYNRLLRRFETSKEKSFEERLSLIINSGLIDANWYKEVNFLDKEMSIDDVAWHYLVEGDGKGYSPHPLFDLSYYRSNFFKFSPSLSTLEHYICVGISSGLSPSPLFDPKWYRKQADFKINESDDPFRHFLEQGGVGNISPHPLFDSKYYVEQEPSLTGTGVNPLTHFVGTGGRSGRNPNPIFDTSWYLAKYLKGNQSENPLSHFLRKGASNQHQPHPKIDLQKYMFCNSNAPQDPVAAYIHILKNDKDAMDDLTKNGTYDYTFLTARVDRPNSDLKIPDLDNLGLMLKPSDRVPPINEKNIVCIEPNLNTKLVSVDIWDTVLRRDCHPDEIKAQSARLLFVRHLNLIRPAFRSLVPLYNARISAENISAPKDDFEFRLENAFNVWLDTILIADVLDGERKEILEDLIAHEMVAERRCTRVDKNAREILNKLRIPAIFTSDFYCSAQWLSDLLEFHGMRGYFIRGYSSSDTYETKRSGELFGRVLFDSKIKPEELFHFGDNPLSDLSSAKTKGVEASLFENKSEIIRRSWYEDGLNAWRNNDSTIHERRIMSIAEDIAVGLTSEDGVSSLRACGARVAPLVIGYVLGIIEKAAASKLEEVHYFTREGLFFEKVHNELLLADPYNIKYARAEVLEVSRQATFAASLSSANPRCLMRLWSQYSTQSLRALAKSLNMDLSQVAALAENSGICIDESITYPWKNSHYIAFLSSKPFQMLLEDGILNQRKKLMSYLAKKNIHGKASVLISDIGWRGTIQDNLATLLPDTFFIGHYIGLFNYLNPQPINTQKLGWAFDVPGGISAPVGDVAPLEMMFNGVGGSVTGYSGDKNNVVPIKSIHLEEENVISGPISEFQAGVLKSIRPIADYIRRHGLTASSLRRVGGKITESLSERSPSAIADTFYSMHHNETFGVGRVEIVAKSVSLDRTLAELDGSLLHANVSAFIKADRWPEGIVRTSPVANWWRTASQQAKVNVPIELTRVYSPAAIRARGSRIAIFAPPPILASGGHRTIFNMVRKLASLGFDPEIFLEGVGAGVEVVENYLGNTRARIHTQWHKHIPSDVAFATIAHSANFVRNLQNTHHKGYLVQDFEALFNPMSDAYLIAERSYSQGLQHFTIGNWLTHVINTRYGAAAAPAGLGADTDTYFTIESKNPQQKIRELAICFLYQPDKPRRTPLLGIDALRIVKQRIPECKIYVFGSTLPLNLDFEVENLGLITDLSELNNLYNRCTAGLCISGSNPSRIPYEMMAAGCVPVDIYRYNNLLDHKTGTILLAHQDPLSVADALIRLVSDSDVAKAMSAAAQRHVASRTLDWEQDVIANNLLALMDGELPHFTDLSAKIYDGDPIVVSGMVEKSFADNYCKAEMRTALQTVKDMGR